MEITMEPRRVDEDSDNHETKSESNYEVKDAENEVEYEDIISREPDKDIVVEGESNNTIDQVKEEQHFHVLRKWPQALLDMEFSEGFFDVESSDTDGEIDVVQLIKNINGSPTICTDSNEYYKELERNDDGQVDNIPSSTKTFPNSKSFYNILMKAKDLRRRNKDMHDCLDK